ncbi:MAG: uncharacterized protein K0R66_123 [Gammaproteobacteria bacterium]|nr:uncharacterized protein [Gammaproteobacteria bacterium]
MQGRHIETELDQARELLDGIDLLDSNESILEQYPEHALDYSQAMVVLASKSLIRANKPKLLDNIAHISQLAAGLESLDRSDLLSQANVEWLFAYPELANDIAYIVKILSQYDALNEDYKGDLSEVKQSITHIANILEMLHRQDLLQNAMVDFIFKYWRESDQIDKALEASLNSHCLSAERVGRIFDYVDNSEIKNVLLKAILWIYANLPEKADELASELIESIKPDGYRALTEENLQLLKSHPDVGLSLIKALALYCTDYILMPEDRAFLIERAHHAEQIVNIYMKYIENDQHKWGALSTMSLKEFKKNIDQLEATLIELTAKPELGVEGLKLNAEEFNLIIENIENVENMIAAFKAMALADIFSQANMNILIESMGVDTYTGSDIANILGHLQQGRMLDQGTFNLVCQHANNAYALDILCENLSAARILSLANFEASLPYLNNFQNRDVANLLNNMPLHLLTQHAFDHIILICREAEQDYRAERIQDYAADLIVEYMQTLEAELPPEMNYAQSTHARSVHQSVSLSAQKLFERYKDAIDTKAKLDSILESLITWSEAVEDHTNTVKSCINRITEFGYTFEDRTSQISMRQLLALIWKALHDDANRHGSLEDALDQFKKGMYQIQRGYNLDEHGNDDGSEDRPICVAGTFNKIIEQLQGIHPDVEIKFITIQTATLKLPKLIKEQAKQFLQALSLSNPDQFNELCIKIKAENLEAIWEKIKPKVCDAMFEEFSCLFNSKEDIGFKGLIEAGQYCELDWDKILPAVAVGSSVTVFAGSLGAAGGAGHSMQSNP